MKNKMVLVKPLLSEKSSQLSRKGTYVFVVENKASKLQISEAVETEYKTSVASVRTIRVRGKMRRITGRPGYARRDDWKKAYVSLVKGESIAVYGEA
jgi:large subunit ribosomal protein L23